MNRYGNMQRETKVKISEINKKETGTFGIDHGRVRPLMLYQTQHPHFFQFQAFTSTPPPPPPSPVSASDSNTNPNSLSSSTPVQVQEMEGALKSSLMKEMDMKSSPQEGSDDFWPVNAQNGASCDDDFVNEFFDFSNDEGFIEPQQEQEQEEEKDKSRTLSVPVKQEQEFDLNQDINYDDFGPIPAEELAVPTVDVENLEWLSHFVEDSFSEYSSPIPAGTLLVKPKKNVSEPEAIPVVGTPCFKTPIPAKARSKRARSGGRVWSLDSPSLSDSSTSSTSSPYSSSPPSPLLIYTDRSSISILEPIEKGRKQKKKSMTEMVSVTAGRSEGLVTRRCSHCGVVKTPQWRAGPLGAKTLCNACGVRYKSGRLLPEYRPACSPTFSSELHSNHHRKVLEMRRKKELLGRAEPGLAPPAPVVRSF